MAQTVPRRRHTPATRYWKAFWGGIIASFVLGVVTIMAFYLYLQSLTAGN